MTYIYALIDPRNRSIRYVGQSSKNPIVRFGQHLAQMYNETNRKSMWLRELAEANMMPELVILEVASPGDANTVERFWIEQTDADLNSPPHDKGSGASRKGTKPKTQAVFEYLDRVYVETNQVPGPREIEREVGVSVGTASMARSA